jgi:3-oxoacyl-[acyl-carrier protein] reductase
MGNDLAGKVALVTGASKGIGAGIATAFGQAGANVAVGYARDHEGAERVAGEIKAAGGRAITVQGDLAKTGDIEAMVAKAVATFGPIDTLVNNAAVFDFKALPDIDEAHFHHIFKTNVLGLLTTTKVAVANFNSAGGSVINISSLSALGNAPNSAVYASSKAAVNAITKVLALDTVRRRAHFKCARLPRRPLCRSCSANATGESFGCSSLALHRTNQGVAESHAMPGVGSLRATSTSREAASWL